ncbi:MAG: hypothetical protein KAS72_05330 [Phycisphaerales bacterium]|nr:hypothetical protein [Phycisphaerales bacterium]
MTAEPAQHEAQAMRTEVLPPTQRIFMPQARRERIAATWWRVARELLFRWSPRRLNAWRIVLLRMFGANIGANVRIASSTKIDFPWNLSIGDGTDIEHGVIITCMGDITIGSRVRISQYAHFCAGTHEYERRDMRIRRCPITVGDETWIGADVFVGPDVTIGSHVIVGARSSVFSDLSDEIIAVGNTARKIRDNDWLGPPV